MLSENPKLKVWSEEHEQHVFVSLLQKQKLNKKRTIWCLFYFWMSSDSSGRNATKGCEFELKEWSYWQAFHVSNAREEYNTFQKAFCDVTKNLQAFPADSSHRSSQSSQEREKEHPQTNPNGTLHSARHHLLHHPRGSLAFFLSFHSLFSNLHTPCTALTECSFPGLHPGKDHPVLVWAHVALAAQWFQGQKNTKNNFKFISPLSFHVFKLNCETLVLLFLSLFLKTPICYFHGERR